MGSEMCIRDSVYTLAVLNPDIVFPDLVFRDALIRMIGGATHATLRGMGFCRAFFLTCRVLALTGVHGFL